MHEYCRSPLFRIWYSCPLIALPPGASTGGWMAVPLRGLAALFGGFDIARYVHFFAMAGIAGFGLGDIALARDLESSREVHARWPEGVAREGDEDEATVDVRGVMP